MTAADEASQRDPLDLLTEEYLKRRRAGDPVSVDAFAEAHPDHAGQLRELLPTLQALEQLKREKESTGGARARVTLPAMQRLGDFAIVRELGRGGMGVVFEAMQESLGRKVALKVLPQAALLTGSQLQRFRREAQTAAQLHHSNIVPVFGSGESDGFHWYAMQFIAGESLDHWRQAQAAQPPRGSGAWTSRARFVARIGAQAASALHYAHGQGTLHRDVKPANLLLEHGEHLWVTDFGLAKALEAEGLTHSGDLLGTLQYMAPEQFAGQYDARSEVYALGVTLYELLVLRPAFAAKTRSELMERIRTQRPDALRRLCPDVPEDLAVVVEHAMARDPADRYADAQALQRDLLAFLDDRPIAARRQSAARQVLRWCRRNRAMAALGACTVFAVVAAGVTGWVAYGITKDALGEVQRSAGRIQQESGRANTNLRLALAGFGDVFDALVGRDPTLALDEDPDTGEQTVIVRAVVDAGTVELLHKMLRFYDEFAAQNAGDLSLRFETARAWRRVGAIHVLLGKPENLDQAAQAYDQALLRLADVSDRDVTRELAAVHVDFGRLEHRRNPAAAPDRFRQALRLLETEQAPDGKALRFERADAHFLLAQSLVWRPGGSRRPPPGTGGRPGGERNRPDPRPSLQTARALVDGLLADDADNREFLALKARCLLFESRLRSRPAEPADGPRDAERAKDPERDTLRAEGLDILRALVAQNPTAEHFRFELCDALAEDWRRDAPSRRRREDAPATRPTRNVSDEELAALREAKVHAERLLKQQPLLPEYQALRGRTGSWLGQALRERSETAADPDKLALRTEAVDELQAALHVELQLLAGGDRVDPRFATQVLATRRALASAYEALGRRREAVAEAHAIVDLLERVLDGWASQGGPPQLMPGFLLGSGEGAGGRFEALLHGLDQAELMARVRKVRERWPGADTRGRPASPERGPGPERRGGR